MNSKEDLTINLWLSERFMKSKNEFDEDGFLGLGVDEASMCVMPACRWKYQKVELPNLIIFVP